MEIVGYFSAILIGVLLGLIGGGGSILTLPVLVYLFGVDAVLATAYSLFIVGVTSAFGSIAFIKNRLIHFKTALVFGLPSIISVYLTRAYLLPAIPNEIHLFNNYLLSKNVLLMLLFALLMLAASYSMIKKTKTIESKNSPISYNFPLIFLEGGIVGVFTGLVGAGGGFLIIPALVVLSKLPIKTAIGTSLLIIAAKSIFGFIGALHTSIIEWEFIILISTLAILGIVMGSNLSKKIDAQVLKPAFGWFTLAMGFFILAKELL